MSKKTNVCRLLDQAGIAYKLRDTKGAKRLDYKDKIFKTLVTEGRSGENYVFVLPLLSHLDLKKAAKAVGEKKLDMIKQRELKPLTGYIHGGCSPIGMKKSLVTVIDRSAQDMDSFIFSAGEVGKGVQVNIKDLEKIIDFSLADVKDQA